MDGRGLSGRSCIASRGRPPGWGHLTADGQQRAVDDGRCGAHIQCGQLARRAAGVGVDDQHGDRTSCDGVPHRRFELWKSAKKGTVFQNTKAADTRGKGSAVDTEAAETEGEGSVVTGPPVDDRKGRQLEHRNPPPPAVLLSRFWTADQKRLGDPAGARQPDREAVDRGAVDHQRAVLELCGGATWR